jgi:hypothetical protein
VVIKYGVPIEVITLLVLWVYQSASVENWYDPISTFSRPPEILNIARC